MATASKQITDAVTQTNVKVLACGDAATGIEAELLGDVVRALGIATQKKLDREKQAEALILAASIMGIKLSVVE